MKYFTHAGDIGDLIYALHTIKLMGGGTLILKCEDIVRDPFNKDKVEDLKPFLIDQPYIEDVLYNEKKEVIKIKKRKKSYSITFTGTGEILSSTKEIEEEEEEKDTIIQLDKWRDFTDVMKLWGKRYNNIAAIHAFEAGLKYYPQDEIWLTCSQPKHIADVVISRSSRYQNSMVNWNLILANVKDINTKNINNYYISNAFKNNNDVYNRHKTTFVEERRKKRLYDTFIKIKFPIDEDVVFVGFEKEYKDFVNKFGFIKYYPTPTFYELFQVIAGCKIFCGNQSSPMALAIGLGKERIIQEVCPNAKDCKFNRPSIIYLD